MIGLPSAVWRGVLPRRRDATVSIDVEPQTFEASVTHVHRALFWSWSRVVQRTFVVRAVSLRELLTVYDRLRLFGAEMHGLAPREALYIALGDRDALHLGHERAKEIWDAWREVNQLALSGGASDGSSSREGSQTVLDLVFDLERFPFNYATDRVLAMSAAEATGRLARWFEVRVKEAPNS